ncbi:cisplatin damage response ATP-dependent DNA ligase [Ancylobacter mangrovi]|uniref:cisplatin damage response ATP-dependent DNA ligase n=1 Tax=Ancylobacter mangrovi TaxID=2972472 RepID=UPI0021634244|nr:cisplatin damage response ATP-dependent DNA ligase [Ancylobacter mangrovi]MCS0503113.1 cisplatin damage response ATP-dependent DNA ligase [Ancylobacter mangrovi]
MNRFAALLDRLAYEPRRNGKIRLIADYFRHTPDPERGYALAALTGALSFRNAKPGLIRQLIAERTDPVLFALSYDYVGDLSETVALMWPAPPPDTGDASDEGEAAEGDPPSRSGERDLPLSAIVDAFSTMGRAELPAVLAALLDRLDETGRWALLKLITGGLRIGVSARLAKTAVAALGEHAPDEIELVWPGLAPPYEELFAWAEGHGPRPETDDPAPFRPVMLSHPIEDPDFAVLDPADFRAEWKWDGIRIQAVRAAGADGRPVTRLYSRTGEDISGAFPDLSGALAFDGAVDGELLILREGRVQSFNVLQQRLNRKVVSAKLIADFPAHIRAYDLLVEAGEDLRELPFDARRTRLAALVAAHPEEGRLDLSPLVPFASWEALAAARADPAAHGAGADAEAVEGVMLKRADSAYLPGRPKGPWWKWKRDPHSIDAVLMYAQRGHGKRSSYYSDYTFGVWTREGELVPVGKAYFGFTDAELIEIDRFVRRNTVNRFGPVREVVHTSTEGLVLEVAFEGLARSTRHRSGLAMRFPRIARLRWDKPPGEADRLETLEAMIGDEGRAPRRPSPVLGEDRSRAEGA